MSNIIKKFDEFSIILEKKSTKKVSEKDSSKSDEAMYLTPKQRKLPEGFKKSIIAKAKKNPKKSDDDKDVKDVKEPKKIDISKSDEENYLSPKQRKLPDALKKSIIARSKKSRKTKKVNEGLDEDLLFNQLISWLNGNDFELYDGIEDLKEKFDEVIEGNTNNEEKAEIITDYLEEKWGLYEGYDEVLEYLKNLLEELN